MNRRRIEIKVTRFEDDPDPDHPARNYTVLIETNRVLFLEATMETGFACTVLEENNTVLFTEVQCHFARNKNTRNVSKFDVLVEFTDSGEKGGIMPLQKTLCASINFNKMNVMPQKVSQLLLQG